MGCMQQSACTVAKNGSVPSKKHSSKFFKSEMHPGVVAFDVYTESGYCWAILLAAFFLIWGYFSTHQVVFRPWGLQNTKNAFYKKMLCDQASDTIILKSLPTASHVPLVLPTYKSQPVNTQGGDQPCVPLPMALGFPPYSTGPVTGTHSRVLGRVLRTRSTAW